MLAYYTVEHERYLPGVLRCRSGMVHKVCVLDLSIAGCMIERTGPYLKADEKVLIRLGGLSYLPAQVLWVEEDRAGIAFEQPLYEPVLEHLDQAFIVAPLPQSE